MKKKWIFVMCLLVLLTILIIAAQIFLNFDTKPNLSCSDKSENIVFRVIDGDTFQYYDNLGFPVTIRLLCIDTPEVGQEGYLEAKDFLEELLMCNEVRLTSSNHNGNNTDKYGRLLRWVYVKDENTGEDIFVNKLILDEGYGDLMILPPETCNEVAD